MLYRIGNLEATAALPRAVDAHSLLHLHKSKAARAVDAADAVDGFIVIKNPTTRLAAHAYGVSVGSVARALRLPPEEREKVRQERRSLVLPRFSPVQPVMPPIAPPHQKASIVPTINGTAVNFERLIEMAKVAGAELWLAAGAAAGL